MKNNYKVYTEIPTRTLLLNLSHTYIHGWQVIIFSGGATQLINCQYFFKNQMKSSYYPSSSRLWIWLAFIQFSQVMQKFFSWPVVHLEILEERGWVFNFQKKKKVQKICLFSLLLKDEILNLRESFSLHHLRVHMHPCIIQVGIHDHISA